MNSFSEILEKIKDLMKIKSDFEVSQKLNMLKGSLGNHKQRGTIPYKQLISFCEQKGIGLDWLFFNKDKKQTENVDYYLVPKYNVEATAGKGDICFEEEIIDHLAFSDKWIKKAGLEKKKLSIITIKGDSMKPTLEEGDIVLIDHRYNTLKNDSIYVLLMDGELRVKRLQKGPDQVIIVSDNTKYTPQHIDMQILDDLIKIVGKVAWIGKML